ncbi:hypothetical protein ACUOCP_09755, partial [Escherichia sp. R-CC3]
MSGWPRIYYKLLNLPLSILVKSKSIPADPAPELGLDTSRPIMYVLPYNSKADLLTLRAQCLAHDLPDPLEPLEIDGTLLPRYVFIHGGPRVFTYYTPKEESIKHTQRRVYFAFFTPRRATKHHRYWHHLHIQIWVATVQIEIVVEQLNRLFFRRVIGEYTLLPRYVFIHGGPRVL